MNEHRTRPIRSITEFERHATEYARQWATGLNRRDLLKAFGAAGGAAALQLSNLESLAAAPSSGMIPMRVRRQDGGTTLKIARNQASDTLDPHKSGLLVAHEVMWQIYDSLIYLDEKGEVYPGLATAWTFSEDNKTLTFKLREGVNFHDDTPFDANAVKFTVDRQRDPATADPTLFLLGPIDSIEVIDPLTVAYKYTEPFVPLWVGLSYSYCAPISPTAVQKFGDQFGRNPVGTGPYKFVSWNPDDTIVLEKNSEHTWATSFYKVTGAPTVDRVEFVVIPEDATRIAALTSGEIDIISGTDSMPVDKIKSLESEPGIKVVKRDAVGVFYANLNTKIAPMDDVRVRQAINYAIDKEKLISLVLDGQGKPAISPVASAFGAFDPTVTQYTYDPDKAAALMEEAGHESGFETTYLYIATSLFQRVAEVVQEDLSKINIKLKLEGAPVGEVVTKATTGQYGMTFFYYTYSDPDIVYVLLHKGQTYSWSFQEDPELDGWMEQQRVEFDQAKRNELLSKIQHRIVDSALWIFLWEGVYAAAMRDYVEGLNIDLVGFIHLQELSRKS
jgi:peptide/nickel transport system substrate-binding protein